MPKAHFYLIDKPRFREQPLLLACELAKRAFAANLSTLILARDQAQAEELDDLLWSFDPDAYLPHQIAGMDEDEDEAPILIATPDTDVPLRPLLINLRDTAPSGQFDRVLEVVPADESARDPLRERWKHYQSLGFEVKKYDM
ncbi:DNA polymerase III subunit chi [Thermomonas sp.]|uniref:DNA polymerase III subunit chi n=1 Tax=Thermomonas sp. TaxID=1971895 RepID=UPI001D4E5DC6|nr:DNA polymerase III subunit chi [Thermomonas sp.]MBZ0088597.1 DNA polymerase III subunit chi [Thermomonas sp.]MCO5055613.1 DNA polymerase III subunit chi [Thermomonas sp.]HRO63127.1 DNA polymerase III subunit chi [Thermomonas sp.]